MAGSIDPNQNAAQHRFTTAFSAGREILARTELDAECNRIVAYYTLAAAGTGAIPLPAASAAIIAEDSAMVVHIAARYGVDVSLGTVLTSLGTMTALNMAGRTLFIECARVLSWGTGNPWAAVALSGIGATTAGVQTYIVGQLAVAIAQNGGNPLSDQVAQRIVDNAKNTYDDFLTYWSQHKSELKDS